MNILITGGAGTGKSYLSQEIAKKLGGKTYLTSSTGISAIQIGGVTLHKLLGLGLCEGDPRDLAMKVMDDHRLRTLWRRMDTLIIDEVSMLDIGLFIRASEIMQIVRRDPRPWGGIRLILVGDFLQLPPVKIYKEDSHSYKYLFQHPIWDTLSLEVIHLTESKRTDDEWYLSCLRDIRIGTLSDQVKDLISHCGGRPRQKEGIIPTILIATNKEVDSFNMERLRKLPSHTEEIYTGEFHTDNSRLLGKMSLAPEVLHIREGAQVMLLVNMLDLGLCNGSRGVVIGYEEGYPMVRFKNGHVMTIEPHTWSREVTIGDTTYTSSYRQIPLRLSWAITIHKSQGLTLDSAIVRLYTCFAPGMIYVALSRCRSPDDLYIQDWSDRSYLRSRPDKDVLAFYDGLSSTMAIEDILMNESQ